MSDEFTPQQYAQAVAEQASASFPQDLPNEAKQFVISTIYNFVVLAGDGLTKDPNVKLDVPQRTFVCQLIAEWIFHKGIDLARANIPSNLWRAILEKLAFEIFETAKINLLSGFNDETVIDNVGKKVNDVYKEVIEELIASGQIQGDENEILAHSNIDEYIEQQHEQVSLTKEEEERELKLASLALYLKPQSPEKVMNLIQHFNPEDQKKLVTLIQMPDLEKRVDPYIAAAYLKKFKKALPGAKEKELKKMVNSKLAYLMKDLTQNQLSQILNNERINVKNFLSNALNGTMDEENTNKLSTEIINVICDYISNKTGRKLNDNKEKEKL